MNIGKFITDYKEKARLKRISVAQAKAETKKAELKKIKEESDAVRELKKTEASLSKEKEYLSQARKQKFTQFFNGVSKFSNDKPQIKTEYNAKNILKKDVTSNDYTSDRFTPRGLYSSGKKPKSPFM